ncbi:MAG TPA: hypothetical protein VL921_09865 [Candidatus Udaeobacter sp.]|nr:hypothetical protein [Candidatus Udaeobacter sp.]
MKQSKAMKWQLGACGAFAVFLVFGSVQNSAAFQQAHAQKTGDSTSLMIEQQEDEDSIVDDWAQQQPSSSSGRYNDDTESGGWSTAPEQESRRSTGRGGMQSQTGRS